MQCKCLLLNELEDTLFLKEFIIFCQASMFLNFSCFEPTFIRKIFLKWKRENERNTLKSLQNRPKMEQTNKYCVDNAKVTRFFRTKIYKKMRLKLPKS